MVFCEHNITLFVAYFIKNLKLLAAFFVENIVWGFPNAFGVFLDAYLKDPVYSTQKHANSLLPLIGTLTSGIIYCSGKKSSSLSHSFDWIYRSSYVPYHVPVP
jgi:hypothetical protein